MRCGVFLKNVNDFAAMNAVYGKNLWSLSGANDGRGGTSTKDSLVEIGAIALE